MTVTITQNVADIGGVSDNTVFVFRSPTTRLSSSGSTVISTRQVRAKPVAGVLTVVLEPGPATVSWDGMGKVGFTVPTSNSDLWSLIAAGVAFPPDTSAAAMNAAVVAYLTANSAATRTLIGAEAAANKGAVNGYAPLDGSSKVPAANLPSYVDDVLEFATQAAFPGVGETGKIYVVTTGVDINRTYRWSGSTYIEIDPGLVTSVAGRAGAVTLTSADVGLGLADNTPDASKPVSTAQAAADTAVLTTATGRAIAFAIALG